MKSVAAKDGFNGCMHIEAVLAEFAQQLNKLTVGGGEAATVLASVNYNLGTGLYEAGKKSYSQEAGGKEVEKVLVSRELHTAPSLDESTLENDHGALQIRVAWWWPILLRYAGCDNGNHAQPPFAPTTVSCRVCAQTAAAS